MRGHVRMVVQNRLSDLIRSEVGSANPKKTLIAGSLLAGTLIVGLLAAPKSAMAVWPCKPGFHECGPEWQGLCCEDGQGCCYGSWCTWGQC